MTALKYWNGTAWVTLPDSSAKQVWTGPDAPVPIGDHRLWIDTDEPDSALVASPTWHSFAYAPQTAAVAGWKVTPIPTDANFVKTGDANAYVRNADGSLTVRDAGVYSISASISLTTGGGALISKGIDETVSNNANFLTQSGAAGNLCQLSFVGYLPAAQVISLLSYFASATARQTLAFSIARMGTGPAGPPGPVGPGGIIATQRIDGIANGNQYVVNGMELGRAGVAGTDFRLSYTPPVNAWWEIDYIIPYISKDAAAWGYVVLDVRLIAGNVPATSTTHAMAPGADVARAITSLYGPGGSSYTGLHASSVVALSAGVTYTLAPMMGYSTSNFLLVTGSGDQNTHKAIGKVWAR